MGPWFLERPPSQGLAQGPQPARALGMNRLHKKRSLRSQTESPLITLKVAAHVSAGGARAAPLRTDLPA